MTDEKGTKSRGRPSGLTDSGRETKDHLYQVGLKLIRELGFEKATMRKMAEEAKVSPALFYKYYPNKEAIVLELHHRLTSDFEIAFEKLAPGTWTGRSLQTLKLSIEVLRPHREALKNLTPILVGSSENNVFSEFSSFSRERIERLFYRAIADSKNPLAEDLTQSLSRVTYLIHMAVLLFWLMDRSPQQKATQKMIDHVSSLLEPFRLALKLPGTKKFVTSLNTIIETGLYGWVHKNPNPN